MDIETSVHVKTLQEWHEVLSQWFEKGYDWHNPVGEQDKYMDSYYFSGDVPNRTGKYLSLDNDGTIVWANPGDYHVGKLLSFDEFLLGPVPEIEQSEQTTFYVTEEQLEYIEYVKTMKYPLYHMVSINDQYTKVLGLGDDAISHTTEHALLRYLGGDPTITFLAKGEPKYVWVSEEVIPRVLMRYKEDGDIITQQYIASQKHYYNKGTAYHLTEEEVRNSVYNPEKFIMKPVEDIG